VASGSRILADYTDPEAPVLAVRLQDLSGSPRRLESVGDGSR
jgi:hypothetical protein